VGATEPGREGALSWFSGMGTIGDRTCPWGLSGGATVWIGQGTADTGICMEGNTKVQATSGRGEG